MSAGGVSRDGVDGADVAADLDPDLGTVVQLERQLLDPEVRATADRVSALLHPDFVEHGASGRVWDRDAVVATLPADPVVVGKAGDFVPVRLAEHVVLLTYRISGSRESMRSSVWVRDRVDGWRLRFHQGTLVPRER